MTRKLRRPVTVGFFVFAAALVGLMAPRAFEGTAHSVPVPVPVYSITAISGSHTASLLNLPIGQPGVPQAPIPVDIDGDLLPDVTVAVNFVNVSGVFNNPPNIGAIVAPNIQINRIPTANLLGQPSLPLKIFVTLTVLDSTGGPKTTFSFGYDTALGGSIPESFTALVNGLNTFFNPVEAIVDTTGTNLGVTTGTNGLGLNNVAAPYQGPLSIIGNVNLAGKQVADLNINYRPFPKAIDISYLTDSKGQHITYSHGVLSQVDMTTVAALTQTVSNGKNVTNVTARFDRLPRSMKVDISPPKGGSGAIDFNDRSDGRPPDIGVQLNNTAPNVAPLNANLNIEGLPASMHGEWTIGPNGIPGHAAFAASGQGIGAVEAYINNWVTNPTLVSPYAPNQRQFFNFQQVAGGPFGVPEQLISGRIERIRSMSFDQTSDGYKGDIQIGDGELPLQAHVGIDNRTQAAPQIEAVTQISPLPDHIAVALHQPGADQATNPLRLDYTSSKTIDVDANLVLRQPTTLPSNKDAACGDTGTICGNVAIRNIPSSSDFTKPSIEARFIGCPLNGGVTTCPELLPKPLTPEARIEIDDVAGNGGVQPDITADATVGPGLFDTPVVTPTNHPVPLVVHFQLQNFPSFVRIRQVQGANKTLERMEFHTCDYDYAGRACAPMTESEIGAVSFNVRDWVNRPASLSPPPSNAPQYATVTATGAGPNGPSQVLFEAAGQVTHIRELDYVNNGDVFGIRTRLGPPPPIGPQDFLVDANLQKITMPNPILPPASIVSLHARAIINPLPSTINVCFRNTGTKVQGTPFDALTARCETNNPFGDQTLANGSAAPLAFAFDDEGTAPSFNVITSASASSDQGTPLNPADDLAVAGHATIANIPGNLAAYVAMPRTGASQMRGLLTTTNPPTGLNIDLGATIGVGGASCDDPSPAHTVACATASIQNLSPNLSFLMDPTQGTSRTEFHACNWQFLAATPGCLANTGGTIGQIAVNARLFTGAPHLDANPNPIPLRAPILVPTQSPNQYVTVSAVGQAIPLGLDLRAGLSILNITDLTFDQAPDGFDSMVNLGGACGCAGSTPLELKAALDVRDPLLATGLLANADVLIRNLPIHMEAHQHGTGTGASPTVFHFNTSQTIDVDATAQLFLATAFLAPTATPICGNPDTACGTLDIDRIPSDIQLSMGTTDQSLSPTTLVRHATWDVATDSGGQPKPDIFVDGIVGLPSDTATSLLVGRPIEAHAELLGLPPHVHIRQDSLVTNPNTATETTQTQHMWVETCHPFVVAGCPNVVNTVDQLDRVSLRVADFAVGSGSPTAPNGLPVRPPNFPSPTDGLDTSQTPIYATAVARGDGMTGHAVDAEVAVNIPAIKELQYIDKPTIGVKGFRVAVGNPATANGLAAKVDVSGIALPGTLNLGGETYHNPVVGVKAIAQILSVPTQINVCIRQAGISFPNGIGGLLNLPAASTDFTGSCENPAPFTGPGTGPLDHTPLSVGYHALGAINHILTDATATLDGVNGSNTALPTDHVTGHLDISHVPPDIDANLLTPLTDSAGKKTGATRFQYDAPASTGSTGIGVNFSASETLGDAICKDPRPTVTSLCVKGTISNLPQHVDFYYDPNKQPSDHNLTGHVDFGNNAVGSPTMDITGLELDSVKPACPGGPINPATLLTCGDLIATGSITGIGNVTLDGTINAPKVSNGAPAIALNMTAPISNITLDAQNFVAPDPTPSAPPSRPFLNQNSDPLDQLFVWLRGSAFRGHVSINNFQGVSYRTVSDANGNALDTQVIGLKTTGDKKLRAYADIAPDTATRIIGDVALLQIPADINVCFRGQKTHVSAIQIPGYVQEPNNGPWFDPPATGQATYCDGSGFTGSVAQPADETPISDGNGVIQFAGTAANKTYTGMTLDAFARVSLDSGNTILSGRVNVVGIPYRIEGIIPASGAGASPNLDISGRTADGSATQGIGRIEFHAADFDLPNLTGTDDGETTSGYPTPPFVPVLHNNAPFPAKITPNQHLGAVIVGGAVEFVGRLGVNASGGGNQLQRVRSLNVPCAKPDNRTDYPFYPTRPFTPSGPNPNGLVAEPAPSYQCIAANFDTPNGGTQLDLNAYVKTGSIGANGDEHIALYDAGITAIPNFLQVTLANGPTQNPPATTTPKFEGGALLPRCDTDANTPDKTTTGCAPPMIRFDQNLDQSYLFGVAQLGNDAELAQANGLTTPAGELAPQMFTPAPGAFGGISPGPDGSGWTPSFTFGSATESGWSDPRGLKVKGMKAANGDFVAEAGIRLPIPGSVQIDPFQTWNHPDDNTAPADAFWNGTDTRFRVAAHSSTGGPVPDGTGHPAGSLGQMAALFDLGGSKLLVTNPCTSVPLTPTYKAVDIGQGISNSGRYGHEGDCPDFALGVTIPAEAAVSMQGRDNHNFTDPADGNAKHDEQLFQVDGRLSAPMSLGARVFGLGPVNRVEAQVLNIPGGAFNGAGPDQGPLEQSGFRLRALIIGKPNTPQPPSGGSSGGTSSGGSSGSTPGPVTTDACKPPPGGTSQQFLDGLFCLQTQIAIPSVFAKFDFNPTGVQARQVDATINTGGAKNGFELSSFDRIGDPTTDGALPAPIAAAAYVNVAPLNLYFNSDFKALFDNLANVAETALKKFLPDWLAGIIGGVISLIGDILNQLIHVNLTFESNLEAGVNLIATSHLKVLEHLLHLSGQNTGPGDAHFGPIDLNIHQLKGNASFGIHISTPWPFPDINIGLTLFSIYFIPSDFPGTSLLPDGTAPLQLGFAHCDGGLFGLTDLPSALFVSPNEFKIPAGTTQDVVMNPLADRRIVLGGLIADAIPVNGLIELARVLVPPIFCFVGLDGIELGHPFDAAAGLDAAAHPVFTGNLLAPSVLIPQSGGSLGSGGTAPSADPTACGGSNPPCPPPLPTYHLTAGTDQLCGVHKFATFAVDPGTTLTVRNTSDTTIGSDGLQKCPAGSEGTLTVQADTITVGGTIDANAIINADATKPAGDTNTISAATGNSGAGHAGTGGQGCGFTNNPNNTTPACNTSGSAPGVDTESQLGARGAGTGYGLGGGAITLQANDTQAAGGPGQIHITGTVRADAGAGANGTAGACDNHADDTGTPEQMEAIHGIDDTSTESTESPDPAYVDPTLGSTTTGSSGAGGGSGGGIILSGPIVDLRNGGANATITAAGGNGGNGNQGGGGGGGGGMFQVISPAELFIAGFAPNLAGGAAGTTPCSDQTNGTAGGTGASLSTNVPTSHLDAINGVVPFVNGNVTVPVDALAAVGDPSASSFTLYVCGVFDPNTLPSDPATHDPPPFSMPTPGTNSAATPCGTGGSGPVQLFSEPESGVFQLTHHNVTFSLAGHGNGTWGLYSVAVRAGVAQPTPQNVTFIDPANPNSGTKTDPGSPQLIQGVDTGNPTFPTAPSTTTPTVNNPSVTLTWDTKDDFSGVQRTDCQVSEGAKIGTFQACTSGSPITLIPTDGAESVIVRVTDNAGNHTDAAAVPVTLHTTAPQATAVFSSTPSCSSGTNANIGPSFVTPGGAVYCFGSNNVPSITLNYVSNGEGPAAHPFAFHFDNQADDTTTCSGAPPCVISAATVSTLPSGPHTLHFSAIDDLGNRLYDDQKPGPELTSQVFFIDTTAPQTAFQTVPGPGALVSGWFKVQPFAVLSAVDDFGGAGLNFSKISINGGAYTVYDPANPPRLPPGTDSVCWFSVDNVGNADGSPAGCQNGIQVDDQAPPLSNISINALGTLGLNGFYVTQPTVTVGVSGDNPGGIGLPALGQLRWRVDNSTPIPCAGDVNCPLVDAGLLQTGTHLIGVSAVDLLGNRSAEKTLVLHVDTQGPTTQMLVTPGTPAGLPAPDGSNGWYQTTPYVTLNPSDQPFTGEGSTGDEPGGGSGGCPTVQQAHNDPCVDVDAPTDGLYQVLPMGSGLASTSYTLDGTPFAYTGVTSIKLGDGTHTVCARSADNAGNPEAPNCQTVTVDTQDPVTTISAVPPSPPVSGWYTGTVAVTVSSVNPGGIGPNAPSGVPAAAPVAGMCSDLPPTSSAGGQCVSIDGSVFMPEPNPFLVTITEGVHTVTAFAVDNAGRHSAARTATYQVDLSAPLAVARTVPGAPAVPPSVSAPSGWFRTSPLVVLRSLDGDQNSGPVSITYGIDAPPTTPYSLPFFVGEGFHVVNYFATDAAGRSGPVQSLTLWVDLTPPVAVATSPQPAIWLQLLDILGNILGLSPSQAHLQWVVSDNMSPHIHMWVIVYNATGTAVRFLDGGSINNPTPGQPISGFTNWDGEDQTLTGFVPVGLYYYRVVAQDDAGNWTHSGQSIPVQIRLGL